MKASVRLPAAPPSRKRSTPTRTHKKAPRPRLDYPVFIAHADVTSGRQAMTRLSGWLHQMRPECRLVPMLWRFDQLGDPRWQKMATPDLARAAAFVIALKKDAGPGPDLEAWLTLVAKRAHGRMVTATVFTDGEEAWTVSLQHLLPKHAQPAPVPRVVPEPEPFPSFAPFSTSEEKLLVGAPDVAGAF